MSEEAGSPEAPETKQEEFARQQEEESERLSDLHRIIHPEKYDRDGRRKK